MRFHLSSVAVASLLSGAAFASPTPTTDDNLVARDIPPIPAKITSQAQLDSVIDDIVQSGSTLALITSALLSIPASLIPAGAPASIPQFLAGVINTYQTHPTDLLKSALGLIVGGFAPLATFNTIVGAAGLYDSSTNINLRPAFPPVYPKKQANDAPYSVSELTLRSAIYIPPDYQYGRVPPVILIPGTGALAGSNFMPNFGKLFAGSDYADPVYLNIPSAQLMDKQLTAEYAAYAINYISAISGRKNVSCLSWSAGSLDIAWSFQYWPSTRKVVSDVINISGDYHGTVLAYLLCPPSPAFPLACVPSVLQQEYNSNFISTLRNGGGDSAYVPTTSIYSVFDEIVQPQAGTGASAFIKDARGVGVTNVELQSACSILAAGGTIYTHEAVLFNALAFALAKDALTHPGPAQLSRIDVAAECQKIAADGLTLPDVLATEALIPAALVRILAYPTKLAVEPTIKPYAQKDVPN